MPDPFMHNQEKRRMRKRVWWRFLLMVILSFAVAFLWRRMRRY